MCFVQRLVAGFVLASILPVLASAQEIAEHGDQLDQPYVPLLETLIDHVGEGRIDDAIGILEDKSTKGVPESSRENVKRALAAIYGGGGKYDGHEVVAIRPISSRLHRVYAVAYHERQPLVYTFTMYQFEGQWRINHVHWGDDIAKLSDVTDQRRR